jgi:hypothetical protein
VHISDPIMANMAKLLRRIKVLEEKIGDRDKGSEI